MNEASAPPAREERGQEGKSSLLMLSIDINFFTFSPYILSSLRLNLLPSSGIHNLPQNAIMVRGICL